MKEITERKIDALTTAMKAAAEKNMLPKKEYIRKFEPTQETLELFDKRQIEKENENWEQVKILNKEIKKQVRNDKKNKRIRHLEEELWYDIKKAKTGYLLRHTKLKKEDGEVAKSTERAAVSADFFEAKQWGHGSHKANIEREQPHTEERDVIFEHTSDIKVGEFDLEELDIVLKKCKKNKSTGPDGLPLEFYKWLTNETK